MVWYFHLFQNFPKLIVIHTFKGFGIVNKAEIDVFLELSSFFYEIRLIIFFAAKDGESLYSQQKQDQELTVAQIINSLLPN